MTVALKLSNRQIGPDGATLDSLTPRPLRSPVVIVLAAGKGTRFLASGGREHKLDAPLGGLPVLQHVMRAVEASGLAWHVVRQAAGPGMGDSIAAGVAASADAPGWLILPGDLPLITSKSLCCVAQALMSHMVVVPHWRQRRGHPVGFRAECRNELMHLSGEAGAAAVVHARRSSGDVLDLQLYDKGIVMDIDTLTDLATAETQLQTSSAPDEGHARGTH